MMNMAKGSRLADEIMEEYNVKKFYENRRLKQKKKKQEADKKERFETGDKLIFTGQEYNLAKILNYADIFKDKELIVENILRCPCEDNKNDKIKFKGIDGFYRSIFFDKEEK